MTNSREIYMDVVSLCRSALKGTVPDRTVIAKMDLDAVYRLSSAHMVAAAAGMALESAGCRDRRFSQAIAAAQRKAVIFQNALTGVENGLQKAGIWYMPLKGAVLKDLYPKYGMREFSDHDILFDPSRAEDVKTIMESLGFTCERFGSGIHDVYFRRPMLNFEMHRRLFIERNDEKLSSYYRDVEERLTGEGFEKHFTPEDFYLYFVAHEYKHYSIGGTGLRSLMDAYIYLNAERLDMNYIAAEAEKLGIREFEEENRSLSLHLFGNGALTESDRRMLDYIMSSGSYGTMVHRVSNELRRHGWSKLHYMLHRFSVPVSRKNKDYEIYAGTYPFFYKYKILLLLLPFYRTFRAIKNGRFRAEAKAIRKAKQEPK